MNEYGKLMADYENEENRALVIENEQLKKNAVVWHKAVQKGDFDGGMGTI